MFDAVIHIIISALLWCYLFFTLFILHFSAALYWKWVKVINQESVNDTKRSKWHSYDITTNSSDNEIISLTLNKLHPPMKPTKCGWISKNSKWADKEMRIYENETSTSTKTPPPYNWKSSLALMLDTELFLTLILSDLWTLNGTWYINGIRGCLTNLIQFLP